jgi:hypothetical protein
MYLGFLEAYLGFLEAGLDVSLNSCKGPRRFAIPL